MPDKVSPFAPKTFPDLRPISGMELGVCATGLRYKGRDDFISLRVTAENPTIAAVFTKNQLSGEPVKWSQQNLPNTPRHLVIAAGNANVFTGTAGWKVQQDIADAICQSDHMSSDNIYFAMTGVIGEIFSPEPLLQGLDQVEYAETTPALWHRAASAILTTDTFAKGCTETATIGDKAVSLSGFAKGSGMIAPDMATMLAFVFTDAAIPQPILQKMLGTAMTDSFNSISVDSDTSTSDSVFLIATGTTNCPSAKMAEDHLYDDFRTALQRLCNNLSHQVVSDGEGVTKIMHIHVKGAKSQSDARTVAMSIANSPLVKTAISGEDANWGRIVMAVGKSGVALNPNAVSVKFGEYLLAENGGACAFDVAAIDRYMAEETIAITVNLGTGSESATVYGNDLSYDYIRINADYRS